METETPKLKKNHWLFLVLLWGALGLFGLFVLFVYPLLTVREIGHSKNPEKWVRAQLKQIGLGLSAYAADFQGYLPEQPGCGGFNQLITTDILTDYGVYLGHHETGLVRARTGLLTENNTNYAYIGAGLKISDYEYPVAFEKPWLGYKKSAVLYIGTHLEPIKNISRFENCEKFVLHLKGANDSEVWQKLLENARAVDEACGK